MATSLATAPDVARGWLDRYRGVAMRSDVCAGAADPAHWQILFDEIAAATGGDLAAAGSRMQRQADDVGTGFRVPGESDARKWPLSAIPLMLPQREWSGIADAIVQRAELMELLLADIYGAQRLTGNGLLPAALLNGSPHFLRPMVGLAPPGGHHLHFYAADLARGPTGDWRVLADHTRTPTGAGYALENRLAVTRELPRLQTALNIERLAPFFADVRAGIAASCRRSDPRIALLTPGRLNPSYGEQAHLARYLGLLLVEGDDLTVHDDHVWLRTIEGLKRVDALWRRVDPRLLDPLAFDARSKLGVAGLIDAMAAGNVVIANAPGAGVLESPAFAAFLPKLSVRLTGETLRLPNIATWWCGQDAERDRVLDSLDRMLIAPAFASAPRGLPGGVAAIGGDLDPPARAALRADIARRGIDYVGQELVRLSTLPTVSETGLMPRPFMLRVFAARDAQGQWQVMPGGFARIGDGLDVRAAVLGEGAQSADVCVVSEAPVPPVTLMAAAEQVAVRRNPGTLPSRVADNLFWLGRYLERAENVLGLVRASIGGSADVDGGSALAAPTVATIGQLMVACGAANNRARQRDADSIALARAALDDRGEMSSVRRTLEAARAIGEGSRERLATDVWRLLDAPFPRRDALPVRAIQLHERLAALAGLSAESMGRTAGWSFLDLGKRIERGITVCRLLRALGSDAASADDLAALLDLTGSAISYRQRYPTGLAPIAVRDLIALDPGNPRSFAFQVNSITAHLAALPRLADDGMAEPQQALAAQLVAELAPLSAAALDDAAASGLENRMLAISDAIARRFFLHGGEAVRAAGLTLA
ncbi:MAG: circularly permuted type 2 ATP-grasp protein [Sphingomonadaceae bacterium]